MLRMLGETLRSAYRPFVILFASTGSVGVMQAEISSASICQTPYVSGYINLQIRSTYKRQSWDELVDQEAANEPCNGHDRQQQHDQTLKLCFKVFLRELYSSKEHLDANGYTSEGQAKYGQPVRRRLRDV
jgi:hypothetical protein